MTTHQSQSAATDVAEFITDLDGGMFDRKLSIALSQVASAVVDHDKTGEVTIKLGFKRIAGTHQVHVTHAMKYTKPTMDGKASEEESRTTSLYVGKYGKLTLAPENQMSFIDRQGQMA
ncbi:MAG: hypothetical protein Q4A98_05995 [Comamonadaceae bacterium]|nr:hypothetical protein [Comamonadaceae bacterium]